MPRYKIIIEYDGTNISGWQIQPDTSSIQQFIQDAIESFSQEKIAIHAAGRTDAGVHATGQVAHFDLKKNFPTHVVQSAINYFLRPNLIVIISCEIVDDSFHARFSAIKRHYRYEVLNRQAPAALGVNKMWHVREPLDMNAMQEAANILVGSHDFTSFRAAQCQGKSPLKTIDEISIYREGEKILFIVKAKSFLHHMVRNIVGTLILVGTGKWCVEDVHKALEAKDRRQAGPTAPACGLYFTKIDYINSYHNQGSN